MSFSADTLDLSRLAAPSLVSASYDARKAALLAEFLRLWAIARRVDPSLPDYNTTMLETDPATILAEAFAYGDTSIRRAINDYADTVRLATSSGSDLDHIATTYHRTQRRLLVPATAQAAAIYEGDEEYRSRAQLAPEGLAEFGITPGGYVYKIRSAFADRIKSVRAINRGAGLVEIRVLGRDGDGTVPPALLAEIAAAFEGEEQSQGTDILTVLSAIVVPYVARVTVDVPRGPDPDLVTAEARKRVLALGVKLHALSAGLYREAISSAAHVDPVITARVSSPTTDIVAGPEYAPFMVSASVTARVV